MTATERVDSVMESLAGPMQRLREAGNVAVPTDELMRAAIAGCVKRDGSWRKTRPKGDDAVETLWSLVKFHRSGGSLYGWPWFAPKELTDQLDTVAQVLILVNGQQLTAIGAWQKAMYG